MNRYSRPHLIILAISTVVLTSMAESHAEPATIANGGIQLPTKAVLVANCPTLQQVVLTIPEMDPNTGTQRFAFVQNSWQPQVKNINLDYVPTYGGGGKCLGGQGEWTVDIWDAKTTKAALDAYRDEVLEALRNAVTAASIREEELAALKASVYKDVSTRLAAPLLKEITDLKARIANLEAERARKGH